MEPALGCSNDKDVHPYIYSNQRMHVVTVIVLVLDLGWLFAWIAAVAWAIEHGDTARTTAALTALASPHISIIPALLTVAVSFRRAISENRIKLPALAQFDFGWLFSPALSVPFDVALARLLYRGDSDDVLSWGLATYGICVSVLATVFMGVVYFEISDIMGKKAKDPLTEGFDYFKQGFRPCVWKSYRAELRERNQTSGPWKLQLPEEH